MKKLMFIIFIINTLMYSQNFWQDTSFPDSIPVLSLVFDGSSNIIYAGTNTFGIYKSTDEGVTWIEINNGITGNLIVRDMLVINSYKIFAATENGLFKSTDEGALWRSVDVGASAFSYLTTSPIGDVFAGTWGGIYKSTDEGENWEKIFNNGQNIVNAIIFDSELNIYSHINSDIYRSFNYGSSWQRVGDLRTGPTHHSISSGLVTKNDNILFGTYDGGIFYSSDYGSTCEPRNNGLNDNGLSELLVDEGDHISAITYSDGFFTSIDEAKDWYSFSAGLQNTEPMTLTMDSEGYFYIGSYYGGIYRSKFTYSRFLPQERIKKYYKYANTFTLDSILIKNKSDSALTVFDITSSNSVFQLQSQNFSINPDDSIYFKFSYNPLKIGFDIGLITFHNNSIIDSETVLLKGFAGIPVIEIPFHTVSFWEVELGIPKDTIVIIRNLGVDTLFIDSIRTSNSVFNYYFENNYISAGDSLALHLSFTPTTLAPYEANLILFTNNCSSPDSIILKGFGVHPVGISEGKNLISSFDLSQNYPNPFNPITKISWQSPVSGHQSLKVYDVLGREVASLVDEYKPAGSYEVQFDANSGSRRISSGIYFYRLKTDGYIETRKMLLIK